MKKTLLLLVTLLTATIAFAQTEINGIYYNLNNSTQTAEVTYQYYSNKNNYSGVTSITIPEKITYNATEYSVTSIGNSAFRSCSSLTSITIPNNVTSIGEFAFDDCSSLTSITIPNSVTSIGGWAFRYCSSLTSISIPNSVTEISLCVFSSCESLTSITIPNSVTKIGRYAFSYCSSLTSITIPNNVTSIEESAFSGCSSLTSITIPNSVTYVGGHAFSGTPWLNNQPDGCLYIGKCLYAYKGEMPENTHIGVKEGTTMICANIFSGCTSLTSITIPNSVTSIGNAAFHGTPWLNNQPDGCLYIGKCLYVYKGEMPENTHINVKEGTTQICYGAFTMRSSLTSITIPNSMTEIGSSAFDGCSSLTSITIPNSVTEIGERTFYHCSSLTSITIPNSVTSISNYAFEYCTSLSSITIGNSVTSIGDYAFDGCSSLTSISIPNSVTSIGGGAFYNCSKLDTITCLGSTPPAATYLGANTQTCVLIVPNEAYQNYMRHTYWGKFVTIHTIGDKEIKALANNYTWGKVSGGGVFNENETATLTATANEGYRFVKWDDEVTDNPRTVVVTQDSTFTAIFEPNTFTITIAVNNKTMGTVVGAGEYVPNSEVTLTATPAEGYHFVRWSDGVTEATRSIVVTDNITLTAEFAINVYTVTLSAENGAVTGNGEYNHGAEVTITARPDEGYHFVRWSDGVIEATRSIIVTDNVTLTAEFAINVYTVTLSAENGIAIGAGEYIHGAKATLAAIPNNDYRFAKWSDGNTENPRTIIVTQNISLSAEFISNTHRVALLSENGSVTGDGTYIYGTTVTITATPNTGYHFTQWSDGNTENPRSLVVTKDTTLTAEFEINTYSVTLSAENGITFGAGEYIHGAKATLAAIPNNDYRFAKWSDGNTENPRTIIVTQNISLSAEFTSNTHRVALLSENGSVTGDGTYIYGTTVTITATPNTGYHFTQWSDGNTENPRSLVVTKDTTLTAEFEINTYTVVLSAKNGTTFGAGEYTHGTNAIIAVVANKGYEFSNWSDDNTENPRTIIVTENINLEAILQIETPIIETHNNFIVESADETNGSVIITITAQAIEGFEFSHWSDGNTENPRIITLDKDIELYAYFIPVTPVNLETSKISSANIYTTNGSLHVENATENYHILDAAGRLIYSGNATTLQLPRGIYLVTMGGETQKIVL